MDGARLVSVLRKAADRRFEAARQDGTRESPDAYAAGEQYFPDGMPGRRYYVPAPRGLEIKIGEALEARRARDS